MNVQIPLLIYWSMAGLFSTAFVLGLFKQVRWSRGVGLAGTVACGAGVVWLMVTEKRLPLYGSLEAIVYVSFVLTLVERFASSPVPPGSRNRLLIVTHGVVCLLLVVQARRPMAFNADFFMYDNLWVNLFFNLRLNATALFVWAAIVSMVGAWSPLDENAFSREARDRLMHGGRNYLLTGIAVYLVSEWSGSLWCLNWFGDSWQWSRGFFKAGIIFLLVMTASHLPQSLARSDRIKALFAASPGVYILFMMFQH